MIEVEQDTHARVVEKPCISISISGKDLVKRILTNFKGVPDPEALKQTDFIGLRFAKGVTGEELLTVYGDQNTFGFKCPNKTFDTVHSLMKEERGDVKQTVLNKSGNYVSHATEKEWKEQCKKNKTPWLVPRK